MKTFLYVLAVSVLVSVAEAEETAKSPPVSKSELLERFTVAVKAKDEEAIRSLICWDGPVIKAKMDAKISDLLSRKVGTKVEMNPPSLAPGASFTNVVNGVRFYPNIPVIGQIDVWFAKNENILRFYYGQKDKAFYLSCTVREYLSVSKEPKISTPQ